MKKILFLIFFLSQSSFADSLKPLNQMTEFSDATAVYMYQRCAAMYLSVKSILLTGKKDNEAKEMHAKAAELSTFALMFAESKGMTTICLGEGSQGSNSQVENLMMRYPN